MIFTEYRFALFFGLVFAIYWCLPGGSPAWGHRARKVFLLLASYAFYCVWDWRFLSLLLISTLCDYGVGLALERNKNRAVRRSWLMLSLFINLGMLFVFKYLGFFVDSSVDLLRTMGFEVSRPILDIVLPIGISFYTFQTLSYTLDIYTRKQKATRDLLDVALFVGFFPQLVAGPIVRSREFLPQLTQARRWERVAVQPLLWMFLIGFFKKACVADNIHLVVDAYYAAPESYDRAAAAIAGFLFTVQLYCDFSGYSDMAIACAGLLGYTLPMNFYFPFLSSDYTKLMNRWHMTLSRWVRDYIYLPMVGRSPSGRRQFWCLAVTMFLVGLWHGAAWHFVVWGLGMGLGAAVHRVLRALSFVRRMKPRTLAITGLFLTYGWVTLMLVLFRAETLSQAWYVFGAWFGVVEVGLQGFGVGPWLIFIGIALAHWAFMRFQPERRIQKMQGWTFAVLMGLLVPLCLAFARADVHPFIYFQF